MRSTVIATRPDPIPAPLDRRAAAALIDTAIVLTVGYLATVEWGQPLPGGGKGWQGLEAILMMVLTASYWVLPEWALGATLGKLLFGLRVVSVDGRKCSFSQSVKRNLLRIVDIQFFYLIGYTVARFTPKRQRIGDLWARTMVVGPERDAASTPHGVTRI